MLPIFTKVLQASRWQPGFLGWTMLKKHVEASFNIQQHLDFVSRSSAWAPLPAAANMGLRSFRSPTPASARTRQQAFAFEQGTSILINSSISFLPVNSDWVAPCVLSCFVSGLKSMWWSLQTPWCSPLADTCHTTKHDTVISYNIPASKLSDGAMYHPFIKLSVRFDFVLPGQALPESCDLVNTAVWRCTEHKLTWRSKHVQTPGLLSSWRLNCHPYFLFCI